MDFAILNALYQWAKLNPAIAGAIAALWLAGVVWRGMPEPQRHALELRSPRLVGVLRVVLGLLPDPLVILRALGLSVIAGKPHPGSVPSEAEKQFANLQRLANDLGVDARDTIPPVIVGDEQSK